MLSPEFIEGRRIHLLNKQASVVASLKRDLPHSHRVYKQTVLLPLIEEALEKIRERIYDGNCQCGREIGEKRLLVRPEADKCTVCAEREEAHERLLKQRVYDEREESLEFSPRQGGDKHCYAA